MEFDFKLYEWIQSIQVLKIGVFDYDEFFTCTDPIKQTIKDVANKLKQKGH